MPRGFVAVRQEEVLVAPGLVLGVPTPSWASQAALHRRVEGDGVGDRPGCAASRAAALGPRRRRTSLSWCDVAGVHVDRRHLRDAQWAIRLTPVAKKRRSSSAPGMDLAELRREVAVHGGDVNPDLFEEAAVHHAHDAAAARRPRASTA